MSRASGRFADFFPTAPSVLQEKKRAAQERQKPRLKPPDSRDGSVLTDGDVQVSSAQHGRAKESEQATRDPEEKYLANGDAGDLLNGVGSASSLTSTVSSVFSAGGLPPQQSQLGAGANAMTLTPLTNHELSPPERAPSPKSIRAIPELKQVNSATSHYPPGQASTIGTASDAMTPIPTPPQTRTQARPAPGEAKGLKAIYDPELDPKLTAKDRKKMKVRYKKFGEEESGAPPDPRLAIAGYKSGNTNVRLNGEAKVWKFRQRPAPYTIAKYHWDPAISIGPGPPTSIVVTGFDPFTPESQIRALFGSYGEIAELHNKTDPNTGIFLGVCSIRYRDSRPGRGAQVPATVAAKSAEKQGNGQRIGVKIVRVQLDRGERKCKQILENLARRNRERQAREQPAESRTRDAPRPEPPLDSAPPPNAPKGPSGKPATRPLEIPRQVVQPGPGASLIETEPILAQIRRKPYVFISKAYVPVMGTTIPHLKKRMKMFDWKEVRCDESGYYIVFEDSKRGEDEAVRCYQGSHLHPLFTYTMNMECQQYGNPNYERSPTPERALAEKREREELERIEKEDEMDVAEEKRQRALDLDPVKAALEQLRIELRDKVMSDIKTRVAAPSLYECLDPQRHAAKRQKLGIPDPTELQRPPTFLSLGEDPHSDKSSFSRTPGGATFRKSVLSHNHSRSHKESTLHPGNAFIDERRQRQPMRKVDVRPLHHRLQDFYEDGDSDDEHRTSVTHDTEEQESRSISRMSSVQPSGDHDDDSGRTPKRRRQPERDESPHDDDSGDESMGVARSVLDPHLLKKEPEDMAPRELQLILDTLPPSSKLYKRTKNEIRIRKKTKDDDRLFHVRSEQAQEPTHTIDIRVEEDVDMPDLEPIDESAAAIEVKKKSKSKKKSKKQIFEEREAAKAEAISAKALLQGLDDVTTPETPMIEEILPEKVEEEEEEPRADVEWGVSTAAPRRTVEDPEDMVLDVDGWQHIIKDDEDLHFLKEALADHHTAKILDANLWAFNQKEIKALNNGGHFGTTRDMLRINGYFVANLTGSARTEGVKKILESEKSKYLPHRIKVAEARQRREAEAKKSNPIVAAEAARQAKQASTATSRSARANNRTVIKDISLVKQNLNLADGQQSDAMRFNQLKRRKKKLRFARSAIHGWGLYAEEDIELGDMIIEYVGEKLRQAVANVRELRYDKQGMGSSYLFRIDEDTVVDATKKGGIARFINHSCTPNSTAKIIKVDGEKRIVIYAMKAIAKNEEVVYDYKFAREEDPDNRVPCLCGSANCKGFLN